MAMLGLKVSIASALLPVITQLASVLVPIIGFFAQLMNKFKPLTYLVVALGAALVGLLIFNKVAKMMKAAKASIVAMKGAMAGLNIVMAANPILLVVLAIAALVVGLIIAYKKIGWFRDMVDAAFGAIKAVISAVINWIIDNWKLLATILVAVMFGPIAGVIALFFLMRSQFMAVVNAIKGAFTAAVGAIVGAVEGNARHAVGDREVDPWSVQIGFRFAQIRDELGGRRCHFQGRRDCHVVQGVAGKDRGCAERAR